MTTYPILPVQGVAQQLDSLLMQADYHKGVGITLRFTPIHLTAQGFEADPTNKYIIYFTLQSSARLTPTIKKRISELQTKLENYKQQIAHSYNELKDDRQSFIDLLTAWADHSPLTPPEQQPSLPAPEEPTPLPEEPTTVPHGSAVGSTPSPLPDSSAVGSTLSLRADLYIAGRFLFFFD